MLYFLLVISLDYFLAFWSLCSRPGPLYCMTVSRFPVFLYFYVALLSLFLFFILVIFILHSELSSHNFILIQPHLVFPTIFLNVAILQFHVCTSITFVDLQFSILGLIIFHIIKCNTSDIIVTPCTKLILERSIVCYTLSKVYNFLYLFNYLDLSFTSLLILYIWF